MKKSWLQQQRSHFDSNSHGYSRMYGDSTAFHDAMTARLLNIAGIKKGMKVLDLGCGAGRTTIPVLQAGCEVTGLELSEKTLDLLQQKIETLGLQDSFIPKNCPAEQLHDHETYDLVIGRGILHHLEDPLTVLELVRDALLPGGKAVFMDPNPLQPAWIAFITLHPALSWAIESGVLRHTPWNNRKIFHEAGFSDVSIEFLGLVPPPLWQMKIPAWLMETALTKTPLLRAMSLYMVTIVQRGR